MSRFLLLNFKDFGLNQDITQTIQSQTLTCICCLDSNVPLINLTTCKHEFYLQSFYKTVFEPNKKVVCFECHNFLKRIEVFREQVLQSFQGLKAEEVATAQALKSDKLKNKYNLTHKQTVNIYLPPAKYVPEKWQPANVPPQISKTLVKKEVESMEPALPVVKIKAEPVESEKEKVEIEIPAAHPEMVKDKNTSVAVRTVTLTKEELVLERLKQAQSPSYLQLPYRCESCVVGFNYEENIRDHIKRKHGPKVGSVTCDICLAVLYPPGSLNAHMFRHLTRYECVKCDKRYSNYDDTLQHHKKEHGDTQRCSECHYSTDSPQKFRKHKRLHHKRFTCKDCGVVLATRPSLTRHMAVLHNKRLYRCVHCSITYTDSAAFVSHMRAHGAAAARAACGVCGVQFKAWHAYNAHVLYSTAHSNQRKIVCNHCGMKFATATHLRMHVQFSDHPKQSFPCPDCPKEFAVEAEMKQHRNVHKKQRLKSTDRICDYCGRVYTSRKHLIRHIQIHMQKRQKAKDARTKPYKRKINVVHYSLVLLSPGTKVCTSCGDYVYEYCSIHGPLLVIPDDKVPSPTSYPSFVPRAALTIPRIFLHLAPSTIPDAGIGVFSTLTLPVGVRFGPYRGMKTDEANSTYCWQIFDKDYKPSHILDARDPNKSNWMRYVNCSRHYSEQNLVAFQYQGQLYYRTIKIVPRFTELLVFYGSEFASELHVDLRRYHLPVYTETLIKCADEKSLDDKTQATDPSTFNMNDFQNLNVGEFTLNYYNEGEYGHPSESDSLIINLDSEEEDETGERSRQEEQSSERSISYLDVEKENVGTNVAQDNYNCNQPFNDKTLYVAHLTTHIVNSNNTVHKNVCTVCNIRFTSKSDHINHDIKMHDSNIKYSACTICDYKTVKGYRLKIHLETHSDVKLKCDQCEYETVSSYNLKRHVSQHTSLKSLTCAVCGKIYHTSSNLKRHMRIHMDDNPYICIICEKRFCDGTGLKRHMKTHLILT